MTDDIALGVSVIVPVHNGGELFRACLSSLAALDPPAHELIVVDDSSGDFSGSLASEFGAQVLATLARSGPAHARNLGAQHARGDILFFVDADVVVGPEAVGRIAEAFRRDPNLAALFGSYDDAPAAPDFLSQYKNLMHHYVHQAGREDAFTFWAGCGAIRREVFLGLGGFDERYRKPAIEDIELGYRLKAAGHRVLLLKALQVKHLKRWSLSGLLRADFAQRALPWAELILDRRHFDNDLNIGWSSRISVLAAYGFVGALLAVWWQPLLLVLAGGLALALLWINRGLYRFFARERGLLFALRTIPWHWLYFLYSGLAFAIALGRRLWRTMRWRPGTKGGAGEEEMEPTGATSAP
jgi:glycosyltransferase involved in cell wall biosynthesis